MLKQWIGGLLTALISCSSCALTVSQGINQFSLNLFQHAVGQQSTNILLSPLSVYDAFALLYPGASGNNKTQMQALFHFPQNMQRVSDLNVKLQNASVSTASNKSKALNLAFSVWCNQGVNLLPSYQRTIKSLFNSSITALDFRQPSAVQTINRWVADHTQQMIPHMLAPSSLSGANKLVLINALFFKAAWQSTFDAKQTQSAPFYIAPQQSINVSMMHQSGRFSYMENPQLQMLQLPYANTDFSLLLLLPKKGFTLQQLERNLSLAKLQQWQSQLRRRQVQLALPKVNLSNQMQLNAILKAMGLRSAFVENSGAFLQLSSDPSLAIGSVLHAVHLKMNEHGTVAAAATVIGMVGMALITDKVSFTVNHPYMFILMNQKTGTMVLLGQVLDPK